ncbi:MAG: hypothetical protein QNK24_13295 [Desulfuromusa sp.]|nr:hypothetical protein [Desulfuromusa sp.]
MEKGWQDFREVNRVIYDPENVTIEKMVEWLEKAKTYKETLNNSLEDKGDGS